ncbi:PTS sugar transporter subunit IIA [Amedibacillus sp. YH-ame6]
MEKDQGIILISHGGLSFEMKASIQMITGEAKDIYCVTLNEEGSPRFEALLHEALEQTQSYERVIVFADLYGGSPCTMALKKILENSRCELISGMNLSMVLSAVLSKEEEVNSLLNIGRNAIMDVKDVYQRMYYEDED